MSVHEMASAKVNWVLIAVGLFGSATPWGIHLVDGFYVEDPRLHTVFVYAFFIAGSLSAIVFFASLPALIRSHQRRDQATAGMGLLLGGIGILSCGLVLLFSMM